MENFQSSSHQEGCGSPKTPVKTHFFRESLGALQESQEDSLTPTKTTQELCLTPAKTPEHRRIPAPSQDSPYSSFMDSLSPIRPAKTVHLYTYQELYSSRALSSPPPIFRSPFNARLKPRSSRVVAGDRVLAATRVAAAAGLSGRDPHLFHNGSNSLARGIPAIETFEGITKPERHVRSVSLQQVTILPEAPAREMNDTDAQLRLQGRDEATDGAEGDLGDTKHEFKATRQGSSDLALGIVCPSDLSTGECLNSPRAIAGAEKTNSDASLVQLLQDKQSEGPLDANLSSGEGTHDLDSTTANKKRKGVDVTSLISRSPKVAKYLKLVISNGRLLSKGQEEVKTVIAGKPLGLTNSTEVKSSFKALGPGSTVLGPSLGGGQIQPDLKSELTGSSQLGRDEMLMNDKFEMASTFADSRDEYLRQLTVSSASEGTFPVQGVQEEDDTIDEDILDVIQKSFSNTQKELEDFVQPDQSAADISNGHNVVETRIITTAVFDEKTPSLLLPGQNHIHAMAFHGHDDLQTFMFSDGDDDNPEGQAANRKRKLKKGPSKTCSCKKSKCLKLYCECFASGGFCGEGCQCFDCLNSSHNQALVEETRQKIEQRNPLAFCPKVVRRHDLVSPGVVQVQDEVQDATPTTRRHKRGCTCKKSACIKNYCECFQAGVGCMDGCKCEGCLNPFNFGDAYSTFEGDPDAGGPANMFHEEEPRSEVTPSQSYNMRWSVQSGDLESEGNPTQMTKYTLKSVEGSSWDQKLTALTPTTPALSTSAHGIRNLMLNGRRLSSPLETTLMNNAENSPI